jgi:hypothetical protein
MSYGWGRKHDLFVKWKYVAAKVCTLANTVLSNYYDFQTAFTIIDKPLKLVFSVGQPYFLRHVTILFIH